MRHAVILAGGSGTRLWPASRRSKPKQLLPLGGRDDESLLAATARRLAPICPIENVVVVTAASQAELVRADLPGLPAHGLIAEPVGRNTAAAIGLAAVYLAHRDGDAVMGVLPADHYIADEARFAETVAQAFAAAEERDVIVTVGIAPTRPETGYGYLKIADEQDGPLGAVERFVEKPNRETAEDYFKSGRYLWNAGMFFVKAQHMLGEITRHMPETAAGLDKIRRALESGGQAQAERVAEEVYPHLPSTSIDYGVMERAENVVTLRGELAWNDVGSWSALGDYRPADSDGNVTRGTVITCDAHNNIAIGDPGFAIAVVGVKDLVVVQSGDGILVVPRERAQDVREVVAALKERGLERFL